MQNRATLNVLHFEGVLDCGNNSFRSLDGRFFGSKSIAKSSHVFGIDRLGIEGCDHLSEFPGFLALMLDAWIVMVNGIRAVDMALHRHGDAFDVAFLWIVVRVSRFIL